MRKCYLVCYDIADEKRLRRVHKVMQGFGEAWQYSVYFCVLKDIDRVRLEGQLLAEMNQKEDQILICDMGGNEISARESVLTLGLHMAPKSQHTLVL